MDSAARTALVNTAIELEIDVTNRHVERHGEPDDTGAMQHLVTCAEAAQRIAEAIESEGWDADTASQTVLDADLILHLLALAQQDIRDLHIALEDAGAA